MEYGDREPGQELHFSQDVDVNSDSNVQDQSDSRNNRIHGKYFSKDDQNTGKTGKKLDNNYCLGLSNNRNSIITLQYKRASQIRGQEDCSMVEPIGILFGKKSIRPCSYPALTQNVELKKPMKVVAHLVLSYTIPTRF